MTRSKAPSQRQLRVGEELRHVLAQLVERGALRDPALRDQVITVTEVRVSPDLRNATVFVMPLGGGKVDEIVAALARAEPFLRGEVARRIRLRRVPGLTFEKDMSFEEAARIDALLRDPRVARDLGDHDADDEAGHGEGPDPEGEPADAPENGYANGRASGSEDRSDGA